MKLQELLPLTLILSLPVLGFLIEKFILYRIRKLALKSRWDWDEILVDSLRLMPTLWSLLLALYLSSEYFTLPRSLLNLKDKVLWVLFILSLTLFVSRLLGDFLSLYMKKYREDIPATSLVVQIAKLLVLLVGLLI
ncbi:MAG: hypothetical protein NZ526_08290, partial [Aquificaceae bacterium]|nr:hypothetical protein [Aquificaceae bacterium]